MERNLHERPTAYVPYERRMMLEQLNRTAGQPILGVIMGQGERDILSFSGINHGTPGYPADRVCVKIADGDVRHYSVDEGETLIAGLDEISDYLRSQLNGWRVDARDPSKLGQVITLLSAAKSLEISVEGIDFEKEFGHVWEAVCELTYTGYDSDYQSTFDMLVTIQESELKDELEKLMITRVQDISSLTELRTQPLLYAYLEIHTTNNMEQLFEDVIERAKPLKNKNV